MELFPMMKNPPKQVKQSLAPTPIIAVKFACPRAVVLNASVAWMSATFIEPDSRAWRITALDCRASMVMLMPCCW